MNIVPIQNQQQQASPFDSIRRIDQEGNKYWLARELMPLLGYKQWQKFCDAIDRAKITCKLNNELETNHINHLPGAVSAFGRSGDKQEAKKMCDQIRSIVLQVINLYRSGHFEQCLVVMLQIAQLPEFKKASALHCCGLLVPQHLTAYVFLVEAQMGLRRKYHCLSLEGSILANLEFALKS